MRLMFESRAKGHEEPGEEMSGAHNETTDLVAETSDPRGDSTALEDHENDHHDIEPNAEQVEHVDTTEAVAVEPEAALTHPDETDQNVQEEPSTETRVEVPRLDIAAEVKTEPERGSYEGKSVSKEEPDLTRLVESGTTETVAEPPAHTTTENSTEKPTDASANAAVGTDPGSVEIESVVEAIVEATAAPTAVPTAESTAAPTAEPTAKATEPAEEATTMLSEGPTVKPDEEPAAKLAEAPTEEAHVKLTHEPTVKLTQQPAVKPDEEPSAKLTEEPTEEATVKLSQETTEEPAAKLTEEPAVKPDEEPAAKLSEEPAVKPEPAAKLSEEPAVKLDEEPAAKLTEEPAEEATVKLAEEPAEKATVKLAEEPAEKATVKLAEEPAEKATVKLTEEPADEATVKLAEEPAEKATVKLTEEPAEEATVKLAEEPAEKATVKLAEEATEQPAAKLSEEPDVKFEPAAKLTEEPAEETTKKHTEEPAEEATKKLTEEPTKKLTEEPTEEATEKLTDGATEEATKKLTEGPTEEPTEEATEGFTEEPAVHSVGESVVIMESAVEPVLDAAVEPVVVESAEDGDPKTELVEAELDLTELADIDRGATVITAAVMPTTGDQVEAEPSHATPELVAAARDCTTDVTVAFGTEVVTEAESTAEATSQAEVDVAEAALQEVSKQPLETPLASLEFSRESSEPSSGRDAEPSPAHIVTFSPTQQPVPEALRSISIGSPPFANNMSLDQGVSPTTAAQIAAFVSQHAISSLMLSASDRTERTADSALQPGMIMKNPSESEAQSPHSSKELKPRTCDLGMIMKNPSESEAQSPHSSKELKPRTCKLELFRMHTNANDHPCLRDSNYRPILQHGGFDGFGSFVNLGVTTPFIPEEEDSVDEDPLQFDRVAQFTAFESPDGRVPQPSDSTEGEFSSVDLVAGFDPMLVPEEYYEELVKAGDDVREAAFIEEALEKYASSETSAFNEQDPDLSVLKKDTSEAGLPGDLERTAKVSVSSLEATVGVPVQFSTVNGPVIARYPTQTSGEQGSPRDRQMQANDYIPFDIQRTESPMGHSFKHGASPLREASSPVFTHQTVKSLSLSVEHHPSLIIKSPPLLATEPQSPVEIQDPLDPFATQPPSFFDSGSTVAAFASSVMPLPPHLASGLFGATGLDSSSATIQLPHLPSSTNSLNYCSGPLSHPIGGRECPPSEAMFSGSNPFVNCRDATTTHMSTGTSHPSSINLPISPLLSQTGSNQRSAPCPIRCMGTPTMITNSVPLSLSQTDSIQHSVPCPIRSMATPSMTSDFVPPCLSESQTDSIQHSVPCPIRSMATPSMTRMQASSFVPLPCIPSQSQFDSNLGSVSQISGPLASHGVPPQSFLQQFAQATNYDKLAEAQAQEDVEPPRFSSPFRATRPSHTSAPFTNSGVTELPRRQQPPITAAIEYTTFQGQFHGRTDSATSMSSASSTSSVIVVDHGTVLSAKLPLIGHPQATVPTTFQRPLVHAVTTMQIPSPLRPSPLHLPASSWQVPSCRPALSAEAGWRAPLSSRPIVAPRPPHATHASVYPNGALASAGMRFVQHPVTTMSFLNRQTSLPPSPLVPGVGSKVAEAHAYQPSAMTGSPQMRASPTFGMRPRTSLIPPLNLNSPIVSPVKHRSPTMTTRSNRDEAVLHVRKGALSATSPNVELKLERPRSGASTDRGRSASFWRTCTHSFWPFSPQDLSAEARSKRR